MATTDLRIVLGRAIVDQNDFSVKLVSPSISALLFCYFAVFLCMKESHTCMSQLPNCHWIHWMPLDSPPPHPCYFPSLPCPFYPLLLPYLVQRSWWGSVAGLVCPFPKLHQHADDQCSICKMVTKGVPPFYVSKIEFCSRNGIPKDSPIMNRIGLLVSQLGELPIQSWVRLCTQHFLPYSSLLLDIVIFIASPFGSNLSKAEVGPLNISYKAAAPCNIFIDQTQIM